MKISVNQNLINKPPKSGNRLAENNGYYMRELTAVSDFTSVITGGYAFCNPMHRNNQRENGYKSLRNKLNLAGLSFLTLDFDVLKPFTTLESMVEDDNFIRENATILYYSPSHKPEAPRIKVIFLLEEMIEGSPEELFSKAREAYTGLKARYGVKIRQGVTTPISPEAFNDAGFIMDTAPTHAAAVTFGSKGAETLENGKRPSIGVFMSLTPKTARIEQKTAHRREPRIKGYKPAHDLEAANLWAYNTINSALCELESRNTAKANRYALAHSTSLLIHGISLASWNSIDANSFYARFHNACSSLREDYGDRVFFNRWENGRLHAEEKKASNGEMRLPYSLDPSLLRAGDYIAAPLVAGVTIKGVCTFRSGDYDAVCIRGVGGMFWSKSEIERLPDEEKKPFPTVTKGEIEKPYITDMLPPETQEAIAEEIDRRWKRRKLER